MMFQDKFLMKLFARKGFWIDFVLLGERVLYTWKINSLFSKHALERLARESGCRENKAIYCDRDAEYRTADGTCNNLYNPYLGASSEALNRLIPARYFDTEGLNDPIGIPGEANVPDIPATFKVVREFIIQQDHPSRRIHFFSHALMQFGQYLDHDMSLSPESESSDNCQKGK